jgi:hypothetical protein
MRTASPQALERRVAAIETSGLGVGWSAGDCGHGQAYRFTTPAGHPMELLWDVQYYEAPVEQQSPLRNRPQKRPLRGVPVRRLDHINLMAADVSPLGRSCRSSSASACARTSSSRVALSRLVPGSA